MDRFEEFCRSVEYCSDCVFSDIHDCRNAYDEGRHLKQTDEIEVEKIECEQVVSSRITNSIEQEPKTKTDVAMDEIIKKLDAIIKHFNIKL